MACSRRARPSTIRGHSIRWAEAGASAKGSASTVVREPFDGAIDEVRSGCTRGAPRRSASTCWPRAARLRDWWPTTTSTPGRRAATIRPSRRCWTVLEAARTVRSCSSNSWARPPISSSARPCAVRRAITATTWRASTLPARRWPITANRVGCRALELRQVTWMCDRGYADLRESGPATRNRPGLASHRDWTRVRSTAQQLRAGSFHASAPSADRDLGSWPALDCRAGAQLDVVAGSMVIEGVHPHVGFVLAHAHKQVSVVAGDCQFAVLVGQH